MFTGKTKGYPEKKIIKKKKQPLESQKENKIFKKIKTIEGHKTPIESNREMTSL